MKIGTFDPRPVNAERLSEEIQAALGEKFLSMDTSANGILVRLSDDATEADQIRVDGLITAHDLAALSRLQNLQAQRAQALARVKVLDVLAIRAKLTPRTVVAVAAALDDILDALADIQAVLKAQD